ncbi:DUF4188 domain-containing protein [Adhaeribacter arboris]|uniref:DUF4188 domain-containing protein n=1 Tax=Adhaeribacter arboris TaxID=2072846 RepID=A0A2T2YFS7_9BACT|nr:DUF4188 domain-containing protein [Adhaeribacter arboris]PSR54376.1 DUF4188 domain-containing protein [Adhaeribacter arboris]
MSIINGRMTTRLDREFVVFLIGMRINKFWSIGQWLPVAMSMPRMIQELVKNPASGFLGSEQWFGRTTIMVQYWESFEKLEAYARNPKAEHYPNWIKFNKQVRASGAVGVWHETYQIAPGKHESIYVNMPPFGLGKVSKSMPVTDYLDEARNRMKVTEQP